MTAKSAVPAAPVGIPGAELGGGRQAKGHTRWGTRVDGVDVGSALVPYHRSRRLLMMSIRRRVSDPMAALPVVAAGAGAAREAAAEETVANRCISRGECGRATGPGSSAQRTASPLARAGSAFMTVLSRRERL